MTREKFAASLQVTVVLLRAGLLATILLAALACAGPAIVPPHTPPEEGPYVIGVTDVLLVNVWKNPELSLNVPVRSDGMISVPLIDDVHASGLTPNELKEVVTAKLSEYITAPDVTVVVTEMNSNSISVVGRGVVRSGLVPLRRTTRVLDAIAAIGGFNSWAKTNRVVVLRRVGEGVVEYRFNYNHFVSGKAPESNFVLMPGDTIVIPD